MVFPLVMPDNESMARPVQPKCAECNHPLSFHRDRGKCRALVCDCTGWKDSEDAEPDEGAEES